MRILFRTALVVFVLDQVTKLLVVQMLDLKRVGEIDVWPPFLVFRMAWNRGINFGLFAGDSDITRWILIAIALGISVWVVRWVQIEGGGRWFSLSAGILVGGALGNVVDRVVYGAVADFLNMSCCGFENPYVFNVADIAIFIGALGLVFFSGQTGGKSTRKKKTP